MAVFKRCTVPHWQGNTFVDVGAVRPAGHPQVIDAFFEDLDIDEPVVVPEPPAAVAEPEPELKRGPGRPRKNGVT